MSRDESPSPVTEHLAAGLWLLLFPVEPAQLESSDKGTSPVSAVGSVRVKVGERGGEGRTLLFSVLWSLSRQDWLCDVLTY